MSYSNSPSELHQDVFQYSYPHGYHYISGKRHQIYFFFVTKLQVNNIVNLNCIFLQKRTFNNFVAVKFLLLVYSVLRFFFSLFCIAIKSTE